MRSSPLGPPWHSGRMSLAVPPGTPATARMKMSTHVASVFCMHWLNTHQPLIETIAIGVLALVAIIVLVALVKVLRQGRRAMFGAQPVIGPAEFASAADGGLALVVPFANAAA